MDDRRRAPRIPLLTQVEAQGEATAALGRACDISVGGLLIETPETFPAGATVIVRYLIPDQPPPIQAAGRVVRVTPGKCMAIACLGMRREDEERIVRYMAQAGAVKSGQPLLTQAETPSGKRRSARIPRRMSVVLSWRDADGRPQQESAETEFLSRHGAMLLSFSELEPGQLLRVSVPDTGKKGVSRVVYVRAAPVGGRMEVGLEVLGAENIWEMDFPP